MRACVCFQFICCFFCYYNGHTDDSVNKITQHLLDSPTAVRKKSYIQGIIGQKGRVCWSVCQNEQLGSSGNRFRYFLNVHHNHFNCQMKISYKRIALLLLGFQVGFLSRSFTFISFFYDVYIHFTYDSFILEFAL